MLGTALPKNNTATKCTTCKEYVPTKINQNYQSPWCSFLRSPKLPSIAQHLPSFSRALFLFRSRILQTCYTLYSKCPPVRNSILKIVGAEFLKLRNLLDFGVVQFLILIINPMLPSSLVFPSKDN